MDGQEKTYPWQGVLQVVPWTAPPGYQYAGGALVCERCALLPASVEWHDHWHQVLEERIARLERFFDVPPPADLVELPPGGVFEHTGMGVCNKGRRHEGRCDFGNGV